jgi:hypothetical protein
VVVGFSVFRGVLQVAQALWSSDSQFSAASFNLRKRCGHRILSFSGELATNARKSCVRSKLTRRTGLVGSPCCDDSRGEARLKRFLLAPVFQPCFSLVSTLFIADNAANMQAAIHVVTEKQKLNRILLC